MKLTLCNAASLFPFFLVLMKGSQPPVPCAHCYFWPKIPPMGRGNLGRLKGTDCGAAVMSFQEEGYKSVLFREKNAYAFPHWKTACMHTQLVTNLPLDFRMHVDKHKNKNSIIS